MDWREQYKSKLTTAEKAVKAVKSGDRVYFGFPRQPWSLTGALEARRDELEDVEIVCEAPRVDNLWVAPEKKEAFRLVLSLHPGPRMRRWLDEKRAEYLATVFSTEAKFLRERSGTRDNDVYLTTVSPPDDNGYCSFGSEMWNKKPCLLSAKTVIAEVDKNLIRTYGDNFIHVSNIDYLVEYTPETLSEEELEQNLASWPEDKKPVVREVFHTLAPDQRAEHMSYLFKSGYSEAMLKMYLASFGFGEPGPELKAVAENAKGLIHDGDCIQLGVGGISGWLPTLGVFDNKIDLGYHGEQTARGTGDLIKNGVINGKRKTFHPNKAVFTSLSGFAADELQFAHMNPSIELYPSDYVVNIKNICQNDNQIALNTILAIDFTGQITCESVLGGRIIAGAGGQPESHIGALMSKGGRAISLMYSTAESGAISRIVPKLESGEIVTIPNFFVDYVVSDYGVAALLGKSNAERAEALINIAHPDFRAELRTEAKKMFAGLKYFLKDW